MNFLRVILIAFLTGCLHFNSSCIAAKPPQPDADLTIELYGSLTDEERKLLHKLTDNINDDTPESTALVVKAINKRRDDNRLTKPATPRADYKFFAFEYLLIANTVGYNYKVNQALRSLTEDAIASCTLENAFYVAELCKFYARLSPANDDLWAFFIPATFFTCENRKKPQLALTYALRWLNNYIESVKQHPALIDFIGIKEPMRWTTCWGMAIENLLEREASAFDVPTIKEIYKQMEELMVYINKELYSQCHASFPIFQRSAKRSQEKFASQLDKRSLALKKQIFEEHCMVLNTVKNSSTDLYNYLKSAILIDLCTVLTVLQKHIPKVFKNKQQSLEKINSLQTQLQTIESEIIKIYRCLKSYPINIVLPSGSFPEAFLYGIDQAFAPWNGMPRLALYFLKNAPDKLDLFRFHLLKSLSQSVQNKHTQLAPLAAQLYQSKTTNQQARPQASPFAANIILSECYAVLSDQEKAIFEEIVDLIADDNVTPINTRREIHCTPIIVERIKQLRNDYKTKELFMPRDDYQFFSLGYLLIATLTGFSYPVNRALRKLTKDAIASCTLKNALQVAALCKLSANLSPITDDLWTFFIPTALVNCEHGKKSQDALSAALDYLQSYISELKNMHNLEDYAGVESVTDRGTCWGIAVAKLLAHEAPLLKEAEIREIFKQAQALITYTNKELVQQCNRSFSTVQISIEKVIQEQTAYLVSKEDLCEEEKASVEGLITSLNIIKIAPADLHFFLKSLILNSVQIAIKALTKHIPTIKPLVLKNKIHSKLRLLEKELNTQRDPLLYEYWGPAYFSASFSDFAMLSGIYTLLPSSEVPESAKAIHC